MNRDDRENEICREFDERAKQVNVTLARLELAEALAREEENAAQQSVQLTALRRLLWLSTCVHIISVIVLLYSAFGGN